MSFFGSFFCRFSIGGEMRRGLEGRLWGRFGIMMLRGMKNCQNRLSCKAIHCVSQSTGAP